MAKVIGKHATFRYLPKGKMRGLKSVDRGQLLETDDVDPQYLERGIATGAFDDPNAPEPEAPADGDGPPWDQGTAALAEWLKAHPMNVGKTVKLADGDPVKAQALVDAEPVALDGKPRAGVLKALAQVLAHHATHGDESEPDAGSTPQEEPEAPADGEEEQADGDAAEGDNASDGDENQED